MFKKIAFSAWNSNLKKKFKISLTVYEILQKAVLFFKQCATTLHGFFC